MIIGRDFVFVLPPKSASTSISKALFGHGVQTLHRHEPLTHKPPQPIVAAVYRPWVDVLASAKRTGLSVVYGTRRIDEIDPEYDWFRFVNFTLRFDHLQKDWKAFCELARINAELTHLNKRQ